MRPHLIVFGGLPGTGKSTLAQRLVARRPAAYLRIDAIEQALVSSGLLAGDVGPAGYITAYALARSNLRAGMSVVADSVNPLPVTRAAWRAVARDTETPVLEIEVICTDARMHRRRVETRTSDVPGLRPPDWASVLNHDYVPWTTQRLVVDTSLLEMDDAVRLILAALSDGAEGRHADR